MRQRFIRGAVLAAAVVAGGSGAVRGQSPGGGWSDHQGRTLARGQSPANIGGDVPINTDPTYPIPTGRAGTAGFYTSGEFVTLTTSRALGNQTIAYRGLVDSTGNITGIPGTYVGSGVPAFTTNDFGRTSFAPGFNVELGYRFEDGTRIYAKYLQVFDNSYEATASLVPPLFRSRVDLADTFLVAGVYNFPPEFAGPRFKTQYDLDSAGLESGFGFNTYGVWNAASVMSFEYTQRYQEAEIGGRVPLLQTEYSRVYGLAGGRFAWFHERFKWRTVSYNLSGVAEPQDQAWYTNTLSQRLYGPFVGCGHEVFVANQLSLSVDLTGALLLGVVKERAKYKNESFIPVGTINPVANRRGQDEYTVTPNGNLSGNLWWYPIEGVQVRVGYSAMTYFNTKYMKEAVGFNYGAIDPEYGTKAFRIVHGVNVGLGLFF